MLFFWNLLNGSMNISFGDLSEIFNNRKSDSTVFMVLWNLRLPRIISAIILGGALSVSGFLLQTFFSNPIAGPYVLGISSGAKLAVALTLIILLKNSISSSPLILTAAAFIGSMLTMGFVLILSVKVKNMSMLVVCGILVGYICSAITDFFITFASDSNIVNLHSWSLGSLSGMNWNDVKIMSMIVIPSVIIVFMFSKPVGAYQLGENYARNLGVNIKFLRIFMIVFSSLLSSCVTSFAGPVSFVGIAVPHLVKLISGTSKPIIAVPACFLGGAAITLLCDGIARTVFAPTELSISSVTAFLLVPVVIVMMVKKQRKNYA